jgi:hypothetical protein
LLGVDLNRNHSFLWGCCGGSSGNPCDETYRGPLRESEPETQAFQNFFAQVMRDQNGPNGDDQIAPASPDDTTGIFISLHSYSDLVLWPWGFDNFGNPPNYEQLKTIGRKFAFFNGYDPSGSIWYDVDGATDDWTYGKFGIPSFTFEVGPQFGTCGGFFPPYDCIDGFAGRDFWEENKPTFLYAHKIARTPYMTSYGPDTQDVGVSPNRVLQESLVEITATVTDHRLPGDPLGPIYAAEYFIDAPGEDGTGMIMDPADMLWGGLSEEVTAVIDTSGLTPGQHYILVHGQNQNGQWGPFSAVFLDVISTTDPIPDIKANGQDGPLQVTTTQSVAITVSLDPGSWKDELSDWWFVIIQNPDTVVHNRLVQRPLFSLPETTIGEYLLPEGTYRFFFIIDDTPDGNLKITWLDRVIVDSR